MATWKIKDLKGVGDVELELDDSKRVFVFLGSNGVGKTKTLEALAFLALAKCSSFEPVGYSIDRYSVIANHIEDGDGVLSFSSNSNQAVHFPTYFSQISETKKIYKGFAFLGANQRGYTDKPEAQNTSIGTFDRRRSSFFRLISQAITESELNLLGMNQNVHQWFIERAQSVNPYQKTSDNRKVDIDTVLKALNTIDSRIEKSLNVDGSGNVFLTIEGQERELSKLSSGFISIVKIIQSIIASYSAFTNETNLLNVKGVVLIDEIESHLHVEWQTKIIPTLKKLFPNTTFYIATHSPLVLSQLSQGEAYLLNRDDDGVVRSEKITNPNGRLFSSVLNDAFGIDLNKLKRSNMQFADQSEAKEKLLALLNETGE